MSSPSSSTPWPSDRLERRTRQRQRAERQRWQASIGLNAGVSALNLAAFILHAAFSIVFLVFLNATQPFLLVQLGESRRQGMLSGRLIFADELLSMILALIWGSLADIAGTKAVAVLGYCFVALALYAYTLVRSAWPGLLLTRLLFAVGGSAVTSMLTGILNSYAASTPQEESDGRATELDEETFLLRPSARRKARSSMHGRLAALAGLTTGCGALFAVVVLLPLPAWFARLHDRAVPFADKPVDEALRRGTKEAYYVVAALAAIVACALSIGLRMDVPASSAAEPPPSIPPVDPVTQSESALTPREARRQRLKARSSRNSQEHPSRHFASFPVNFRRLALGTGRGFGLAMGNGTLSLAYIGSALARASTIVTTVFIPLLVTRFFYTSGQCTDLPRPDLPPDEVKRLCRQAFTVASILSGIVQLTALLAAPLVGLLCDAATPAKALLVSALVGAAAYAIMGLALPNDGDPRGPIAALAAVGMGLGQIGAIVASLALCARAKAELAADQDDQASADAEQSFNHVPAPSTSGAIAGAYSAVGGLSILLISSLGGHLSDTHASAAFVLMSALAAATALASAAVIYRASQR